MTELKPCPFCGGINALIESNSLTDDDFFYIECSNCKASSAWAKGKEEAITAWNTRQPQGINWQPYRKFTHKANAYFIAWAKQTKT